MLTTSLKTCGNNLEIHVYLMVGLISFFLKINMYQTFLPFYILIDIIQWIEK